MEGCQSLCISLLFACETSLEHNRKGKHHKKWGRRICWVSWLERVRKRCCLARDERRSGRVVSLACPGCYRLVWELAWPGREWEPHERTRQSTRARGWRGQRFPSPFIALEKSMNTHLCVCVCIHVRVHVHVCAPVCWLCWAPQSTVPVLVPVLAPSKQRDESTSASSPSRFPQQSLPLLFLKMMLPFKGFLICKLFPQFISLQ